MKAIIPCAGFGTRMQMLPHQAKEMLPDKEYGYKYIIDYSLDLCERNGLDPIIVSREEKKEFNDYLKSKGIHVLCIKPKGEWMVSVLASLYYWKDDNILILPDTRFGPKDEVIQAIKFGLSMGNNAVFAMHEVNDPDKWGIIKDYKLYEKPKGLAGPQNAWGLIGFKGSYGIDLFRRMKRPSFTLENVGFIKLDYFKDITRGIDKSL